MNKIKYGICNVHYAPKTTEGTYGTPVEMPGGVSISLDAQGEMYVFYADNIAYYRNSVNNGYSGDLEMALIPDDFRQTILGEVLDATSKVLFEVVQDIANEFALGFQIEGDEKASRFWFYNCVASRPSVEGETKEDTFEAQTETITITNSPTDTGVVRARTTAETPAATYNAWFESVPTPPAQIAGE